MEEQSLLLLLLLLLFIASLAKLGVFYTLTHFGMEKHFKKLMWLRRGEKRRGGEEEGRRS